MLGIRKFLELCERRTQIDTDPGKTHRVGKFESSLHECNYSGYRIALCVWQCAFRAQSLLISRRLAAVPQGDVFPCAHESNPVLRCGPAADQFLRVCLGTGYTQIADIELLQYLPSNGDKRLARTRRGPERYDRISVHQDDDTQPAEPSEQNARLLACSSRASRPLRDVGKAPRAELRRHRLQFASTLHFSVI